MKEAMSNPDNTRVHERAVTAILNLVEHSQSRVPALQEVADAMDIPLDHLRSIYPDETVLLTSVVEQAYMVLIDRCTRAVVRVDPDDPMEQCNALIYAYLCWVVEYPAQFRVMADQRLLDMKDHPNLRRYQESINDLALRMLRRALDKGQLHPKEDIVALILTGRCFVYGTARMIVDGRLWQESPDEDPLKIAQGIVADYVRRIARGSQPRTGRVG